MRDKLEDLFKNKIKKKYKVSEIKRDEISVKCNGENFILGFDDSELEDELKLVEEFKDYVIKGKDFINFILIDSSNSLNDKYVVEVENSLIKKIKINNEISDSIILFNNFEYVVDERKIKYNEGNIISDIIRDEIVLCEVEIKSGCNIDVDNIINSILMHLSFSKGILLDKPERLLKDNDERVNIDDTFLVIKDNEPMLYFLIAEKSNYLHYKYLEYYHVLEYYFLEHKVNALDNMIKELISERLTGIALEESYYTKLNNIYKHFEDKEKRKMSSEIEELQYVINKELGYKKIKYILSQYFNDIKFLSKSIFNEDETKIDLGSILKNKGNFNSDNIKEERELDLNITTAFCNSLSKRIYKIRNSIVHTKKYESNILFTPTNEKVNTLKEDLKLIRFISYYLMKNKQI